VHAEPDFIHPFLTSYEFRKHNREVRKSGILKRSPVRKPTPVFRGVEELGLSSHRFQHLRIEFRGNGRSVLVLNEVPVRNAPVVQTIAGIDGARESGAAGVADPAPDLSHESPWQKFVGMSIVHSGIIHQPSHSIQAVVPLPVDSRCAPIDRLAEIHKLFPKEDLITAELIRLGGVAAQNEAAERSVRSVLEISQKFAFRFLPVLGLNGRANRGKRGEIQVELFEESLSITRARQEENHYKEHDGVPDGPSPIPVPLRDAGIPIVLSSILLLTDQVNFQPLRINPRCRSYTRAVMSISKGDKDVEL